MSSSTSGVIPSVLRPKHTPSVTKKDTKFRSTIHTRTGKEPDGQSALTDAICYQFEFYIYKWCVYLVLIDDIQKIIIITQERDSQSRKLSSLEDDFGSLKVKYDKLIKPARTAKGKYVVSVNFERIKGKERIRFKDSGQESYTVVTEKQLHSKLAELKKKYPKKLYIKIVIPKESGLTYSEAWTFMKDLLHKYDYYYRE